MALSNLIVKAIYQGNGTNTTFAIPFSPVVDDSSETVVIIRDEADPNDIQEIVQTEGSEQDYTLTGAPSLGEFHTDVEFNTAPTSDQKVYVARVLPLTQVLDLIKTGNFDPESIELALDRLTAMVQQTSERVDRSLLLQKTSGSFGNVLPPLNGNEGRVIAIAEDGSEFVFGPTMEAIEAAEGFAGAAEIAQGAAEDAQSSAEAAEASAEAAAAAGEEWALKAQEWAEKDEDVEVEDGKFSAKHHALKSEAAVADVVGDLDDHINDTSGAHAASAISNTPEGSLTATDVQSALNELQSDVDARATDEDLNSHTSSTEAHGAEGAVVGTTNTQTLTNKTFADPITVFEQELTPTTPSFGRQRIYAKEDGKWYTLDSDGIERPVGSGAGGSGQGGINHIDIDSASFESGSIGEWTVQTNATPSDTPTPDDLGTPDSAVTFLPTDTDPLRGEWSAVLTKDAANRQGHFVQVPFTIDKQDRNSNLGVSFDFVASEEYAPDDVKPFVWDVTNGEIAYLRRSGTSRRFTGSVATSDSTEYLLILHVASDSAEAYTVKVDNFQVGPAKILDAPFSKQVVIDVSTDANFTSGKIRVSREGTVVNIDIIEQVTWSAAGVILSTGPMLPDWADSGNDQRNVYNTESGSIIYFRCTSDGRIGFTVRDYSGGIISSATSSGGTGANLTYSVSDNSTALLTDAELMNESATLEARNTSTQSFATGVTETVTFPNTIRNTFAGEWNGSTFTASKPGFFLVTGTVNVGGLTVGTGIISAYAEFNGARKDGFLGSVDAAGMSLPISAGGYLEAGQTLSIKLFHNNGASRSSTASRNHITITHFPDLTVYGNLGTPFEVISAESETFTPSANGYHSLVGNSLTLSPGIWELPPSQLAFTSSGATDYARVLAQWSETNGASINLGNGGTINVLTADILNGRTDFRGVTTTIRDFVMSTSTVIIDVLQSTTIYLVGYSEAGTNANVRITAYPKAKRLR
jgi:hypothetical protein